MTHSEWLRKAVTELENEIAGSSIFESAFPPSIDEIRELTRRIVIHRFLQQELDRRDAEAETSCSVDTAREVTQKRVRNDVQVLSVC